MEQKFVLTNEYWEFMPGRCVHRIRACRDIIVNDDIIIKSGELGGWLEKEDNLSQTGNAWVAGDAIVYDNAFVHDEAEVYGKAWVGGQVQIGDRATVCGYVRLTGQAYIFGYAQIYDHELDGAPDET